MKRFQPAFRAAVAAAALALASATSAQSFRCKNNLANLGDSRPSVLQKCGEPMSRDVFCRPTQEQRQITPASGTATRVEVNACVNVDEWTYNPGRGQFLTTLHFEAGKLTGIHYGERVQ